MSTASPAILFISYDGMTDPLGQSQVIPYLQGLSRAGYRIFLLSCEKKQAYPRHKKAVEEMLKGYAISWTPLSYTKKPPVLSTLIDIIKLRRAASSIHAREKLDMVHTRPGVPALVGLWMKKKRGVKFLNDIREFYADSRVDGKMWRLDNPLYKRVYYFFKKKEAEQVALSDGIVCLTYAAERIIRQWPEYKNTVPLEVIPCSADLELFNPATITAAMKEEWRKRLEIGEQDFIVSYLGSIGGWYLTGEMLRFCKMLSDKNPAIKFLFISPHRHEEITGTAARWGIPAGKIITQKASRREVPVLLSLSRYSIFFIKPCYSKQSSSPTKHGEIMAMGIPLITNNGVGDVEEIVLKYESGVVISNFDDASLAAAAAAVTAEHTYDTSRIREGAREFYSLETAVEKYKRIYHQILNA